LDWHTDNENRYGTKKLKQKNKKNSRLPLVDRARLRERESVRKSKTETVSHTENEKEKQG